VKSLPARVSLDHLKKQAKELLRLYRGRDAHAVTRFLISLPEAADRTHEDILALDLRLHDAQSCVAREYGFSSWSDLRSFIEAQSAAHGGRENALQRWLAFVYSGDVTGQMNRVRPALAARMLAEMPDLAADDPYLACACGDEAAVRLMTARDPSWINRPGGPLLLPPLVAVTQASLVQLPAFREGLYACARILLAAGADPNQSIGNRWPPASVEQQDHGKPLSALYGAAGNNRDPGMTALLLDAGADPNDGESLYHCLENIACTRLLLDHGARIAGSNAMYRVMDIDSVESLALLLKYGGDPNEPARRAPTTDWGSPLLWAIRRRRSGRHIDLLLQAGADPAATTPGGFNAYRLALQFGLVDVAALLRRGDAADALSEEERFVAACAGGDEAAARRIVARRPDLPGALSAAQLRLLPDIAGEGGNAAVMLMVRMGWPIAVRGGDWSASALNMAVFRGDAALTRFLLEHGAKWTERQGFDDDVCGTLSWASCNEPVAGGDWPGCARALKDYGLPSSAAAGRRFSEEVADVLAGE
jgi:ankyrin repeat protein